MFSMSVIIVLSLCVLLKFSASFCFSLVEFQEKIWQRQASKALWNVPVRKHMLKVSIHKLIKNKELTQAVD